MKNYLNSKKTVEKLPYNILVTASGLSPVGIDTACSLKNRVNKIIGVDIDNENTAKYFTDKFYTVPLAKDRDYLKRILRICNREKIDAILPLTIEELLVLSKNKNELNKVKIKVIGETNYNILKICSDKWLTNKYLNQKVLPVPLAFAPKNTKELISNAKQLGYPEKKIVFKPRITHGSRGFRILAENYDKFDLLFNHKPTDNVFLSLEELIDALRYTKKFPMAILMEYLEGEDYSVYMFCEKGKSLAVLPMHRTGLVPGMSIGGVIKKDDGIISYVKNVVKTLNLSGPINIQLIKTKKGPCLYEINARISATTVMTMGTNLNYPFLSVLQAFGYRQKIYNLISKTEIKWGTKLFRIQREMFQGIDGRFWPLDSQVGI